MEYLDIFVYWLEDSNAFIEGIDKFGIGDYLFGSSAFLLLLRITFGNKITLGYKAIQNTVSSRSDLKHPRIVPQRVGAG